MRKLLSLVCVFCAFVALPVSLAAQGTVIERVLVRVNGEILTQSQLTQRQIDVLRERNRTPQNPRDLQDDAALRGLLAEITPQLLVTSVDELLLAQRGRELGGVFTDEQFNTALENIKKQYKLDDAGLMEAIKGEGLTREELRANFERTALVNHVQNEEIFRRMSVTEEELRQYYAGHKDEFMTPATVTLRELFIAVPTRTQAGQEVFNPADDAAARQKILDARAKALAPGGDFSALVQELSESATKGNGGIIGPVKLEELNPELRATLDKLQPGEVTEPLRAPRGYQLLKLESRNMPEQQQFEQVRTAIEQRVRGQRLGGETERLLRRLRQQAVIEWKDDNFRKMYENEIANRK
jgi:peptidyl-prolyl cis-trans isomerase SurA